METLLWLEPVFSSFSMIFTLFSLFSFLGFIGILAIILSTDLDAESYNKWCVISRRLLILAVSLALLVGVFSSLSQTSDSYKKILIYRGINSALVEKSVDTADKLLDVLNSKLDKELSKE